MVTKLFPNVIEFASDFPQAIIDTLLMLVISGLISVVIGIFLAVIVVVTRKDGLKENQNNIVITPHLGEMSKLTGKSIIIFQKLCK